MRISGRLILFMVTLATLTSYSQDTLVFQKRNNENKVIKLPLNEYGIIIKPIEGKRKRVIITDYQDSILAMKVWTFKGKERKGKRKEIRGIYKDYPITEGMSVDTIQRRIAIIDSLREQVLFSGRDDMNINQIDKIIIHNGHRSKMKPVLKATEWTAVGWLLGGVPGFAIFQSLAYYAVWNVVGIGVIIFAIIIENKTLKMTKWEIK